MRPTTDPARHLGRRLAVVTVLVAGAGAVGLLAGCQGRVIQAGETTVLVSEFPSSGMAALKEGPLEVVGGCLGAGGVVIVWPYGTQVTEQDPLTISVPDRGSFTLGDQVQVGGGAVVEHPFDNVAPGPIDVGGVTVPAACAEHDIFLAN